MGDQLRSLLNWHFSQLRKLGPCRVSRVHHERVMFLLLVTLHGIVHDLAVWHVCRCMMRSSWRVPRRARSAHSSWWSPTWSVPSAGQTRCWWTWSWTPTLLGTGMRLNRIVVMRLSGPGAHE